MLNFLLFKLVYFIIYKSLPFLEPRQSFQVLFESIDVSSVIVYVTIRLLLSITSVCFLLFL